MIAPSGDVQALAETLTRLASDPHLANAMGERAREDSRRFTYDIVGRERASLLRKACEMRGWHSL